jgi:alpha-galactosidase
MLKIAFIGAGSLVFGRNLLTDLTTFPALRNDTVVVLEDIDPDRLDLMYNYMQKYKECYPDSCKGISFEKTTNQRNAIENAKYIINAVHIGGLEAFKLDVEIPYKYGVTQCVGDTLGPGGVFRFLRTVQFFDSLLKDIREVGHNVDNDGIKPILLNYTNPMAMNTWYCNSIAPDSTVGLCHGVQGTMMLLTQFITGKQYPFVKQSFSFLCAGINHMAWFLELWYRDLNTPNAAWQDAYPLLKKQIDDHPESVGMENLRNDMMKATGYYMTESSGHLSEYLPYYRKRTDLLEKYRGLPFGHSSLIHSADYDMQVNNQGKMEKQFMRAMKRPKLPYKRKSSTEYASEIINAMETNQPFGFNGNVINKEGGLITNLPKGCCVEVPVFADSHGLHPQGGIELPTICQALCMSNVMVQKAAVEGALELDKEKIYHAVLLDPNTASVCSPQEVREMVDEMIKAEEKWIPKFD